MASLETMVNELAGASVPPVAWGAEKKKQVNKLEAKKKQLWHELRVLRENVPQPEREAAQLFWLAVNRFAALPPILHDDEVNHPFGTVKAVAAGITKSCLYGRPLLELHGTACPAYVPFEQWQAQGLAGAEIAADRIIPGKVAGLQQLIAQLAPYSGKYFDNLVIHTPSPADRNCDFADHLEESMLRAKGGNDQLAKHWSKMKELAQSVPGLVMAPDLPYLTQYLSKKQAETWLAENRELAAAYHQFINSRYVYDSYLRWGPVNKISIFAGLYLGTVVAYGNHESAFDLNNSAPVKLYLNFEEHHGPETFAGLMTGVDVRHILTQYGYHLPLLVAGYPLRTPWTEN